MENVKITCEGQTTEVELKPCSNCGKMSTAEDSQKAVEHERKNASVCAICGGKSPMYPKYDLYHFSDCSGKGGFLLRRTRDVFPNWDPKWLKMYTGSPSGCIDADFHVECLKKAVPSIVIHENRPIIR